MLRARQACYWQSLHSDHFGLCNFRIRGIHNTPGTEYKAIIFEASLINI